MARATNEIDGPLGPLLTGQHMLTLSTGDERELLSLRMLEMG